MFSLVLASALIGSGDFAADIRNAEDFIQLKAEVTQLKAEVAELKARCKCGATQSARPIDVGGNQVAFNFDVPSSDTRTVCSGGKCSTTSRMVVHSTPVQVSSYGVVSGGCSAGSCSQTFGVPTQTFGVDEQTFGVRHFKQRMKCKGCK